MIARGSQINFLRDIEAIEILVQTIISDEWLCTEA